MQITHGNFYVNAYAMFDRVKFQIDDDVMISWLPLFHDMGMVGFLTVPMQFGAEVVCSRRWTSCAARCCGRS